MRKVIVLGNSGSGKSTLSSAIAVKDKLAHLDLDTLAWLPTNPPTRTPLQESRQAIEDFIKENQRWVIEGCYTDLLEIAEPFANEVIFMNLSIENCIENAQNRPWETHKYRSKQEQDDNLAMLIEWIKQYNNREDVFSLSSHTKFYEAFKGKKKIISENGHQT